MLKHSIKADGVVSLFNDVSAGFSIFDPNYIFSFYPLIEIIRIFYLFF